MGLNSIRLNNGETLTYRKKGSGDQTLLLIHGNMTSSQHFDVLMERIPEKYLVYAIDLRGFGGSSYHTPVDSLMDFADDVKSFVDIMKLTNVTMLGWSTGGGVAMSYAMTYSEDIAKLILLESVGITGYPMFKKDEQGQPIIGEFLKTKEEVAADPVQVLPILNAYAARDKETLRGIWNYLIYTGKKPNDAKYEVYLEDMLTQRNLVDVDYALLTFNISDSNNGVVQGNGGINKIKQPTLIFQGSNDLVVPQQMGDGIYEALKENATYKLHEYGHSLLIDDMDYLVENILEFIEN